MMSPRSPLTRVLLALVSTLGSAATFSACASSSPAKTPVAPTTEASSTTDTPDNATSTPTTGAADPKATTTPIARPTTFELDGHSLVLPSPVVFSTGTADLTADAEPALVTMQAYLEQKTSISVLRIEGHIRDGAGAAAQDLSQRRALAVARWLVAHGIDCKRVLPVGFGATKPRYGDPRDNRIEAINAALRGRAIGGMPLDGGGQVAGDPCQ